MENLFVKNVIANLVAYKVDIFGEGSKYLGFESEMLDENGNQRVQHGFNSTQLYGTILYENAEGDVLKSKPVMIKLPPKVAISEWISFSFLNEMIFFTKMLPVLSTPEVPLFHLFPKFYHGEMKFDSEEDNSVIILEDLAARGYRMAEMKSFLNYEHLAMMMRKLGQFHAHSYEAKNTVPLSFYPLADNCQETNWILNHKMFDMLATVSRRGLQYLKRDPAYSAFIPKISEMIQVDNIEDIFKQIFIEKCADPVSVIVHGDYCRNNVMFKYKNNTPDDLVMLDMATCRYGSPVIDLVTVMYLNADQEMRNKHWNDLIDEYYTSMKETFPDNRIPTKDEILSEFIGKSFYGYLVASYFSPHLIADDNKIRCTNLDECLQQPDEDSTPAKAETSVVDKIIKLTLRAGGDEATRALSDILRDLIDRCFICK
ncbi:uncharacterized protein LOC135833471 [Planococcus citri]|uniref:uncharacterized protein LOC135833471 n=1 Tax=Planococcus citri TaxID=170843 RepID=UPI0031F857D7